MLYEPLSFPDGVSYVYDNINLIDNCTYLFPGMNCSNRRSTVLLDQNTDNMGDTSSMFYHVLYRKLFPNPIVNVIYIDTPLNPTTLSSWFALSSNSNYVSSVVYGMDKIDTSNVTSLYQAFRYCFYNSDTYIDNFYNWLSSQDFSKVTNIGGAFSYCTKITALPDFNFMKLTSFESSSSNWLYNSYNVESMGVIDCDSISNIAYAFGYSQQNNLKHIGGFRNLGKVKSLSNTNSNYFMNYAPNLTYESVMNVINLLYDRAANGLSNLTLKLHANHMAMLSDDDIAIATNKGWTLTA